MRREDSSGEVPDAVLVRKIDRPHLHALGAPQRLLCHTGPARRDDDVRAHLANARVISRPSPESPPVTSAVLPERSMPSSTSSAVLSAPNPLPILCCCSCRVLMCVTLEARPRSRASCATDSCGTRQEEDDVSEQHGKNTSWAILDSAHAALRAAVRDVPAEPGTRPTPCAEWNVTQVLQHAAGDQLGYASALTGAPAPRRTRSPPPATLDGLPAGPAGTGARRGRRRVGDGRRTAQEVRVPLPPGTMTAVLGVGACALDAAVHAWDIAVATGHRPRWTTTWRAAARRGPADRRAPTRLRVRPGTRHAEATGTAKGEAAELLRYLGRRPDWTA